MSTKSAHKQRVIDVDAHIIEPYDLWTSRVAKKWGDLVPHVKRVTEAQTTTWSMTRPGDDVWIMGPEDHHTEVTGGIPVGCFGMAGFDRPLPEHPRSNDEMVPGAYDPGARLRTMDEYGIHAQILYPNVGGFGGGGFLALEDADLKRECVKAFNDFMHDWCSEDPGRLIPLISTPFWDLEFTLAEVRRCAALGHRGLLFTWSPEKYGQPYLADPYWNPLWDLCSQLELPINFHIGSGSFEVKLGWSGNGFQTNFAKASMVGAFANASAMGEVISSGITLRYPKLRFVVVESGVGWIPFALEMLKWQWDSSGVYEERPEFRDNSPLDIFKKSIFTTFWFENHSVKAALDFLGDDNIMFETDYPHPTSVAPGPNTLAKNPIDHIEDRFADSGLTSETVQKLLYDNAAKLYRIG
ncbi:MAG: amidohydrolase family protein [Actinomycetota bacterium]